jgi:hypothetical protein
MMAEDYVNEPARFTRPDVYAVPVVWEYATMLERWVMIAEQRVAAATTALQRIGERGESTGCDACALEVFDLARRSQEERWLETASIPARLKYWDGKYKQHRQGGAMSNLRFASVSEMLQAYKDGVISRDEARKLLGLEPDEYAKHPDAPDYAKGEVGDYSQ